MVQAGAAAVKIVDESAPAHPRTQLIKTPLARRSWCCMASRCCMHACTSYTGWIKIERAWQGKRACRVRPETMSCRARDSTALGRDRTGPEHNQRRPLQASALGSRIASRIAAMFLGLKFSMPDDLSGISGIAQFGRVHSTEATMVSADPAAPCCWNGDIPQLPCSHARLTPRRVHAFQAGEFLVGHDLSPSQVAAINQSSHEDARQ